MKTYIACSLVLAVLSAQAQPANEAVQRSSSPTGLQIRDAGAAAGGGVGGKGAVTSFADDKDAAATQQAGSGAVQIQGNTSIKANARNMNTSAQGLGNAARNEVGAIGK
ncbi:hypothetical protein [uncultured Propionivibrio sp.]|uniref:hypothetical protein n=1 Tax=uncultured Propionivibrio sp. TaxID=426737 RepID=UPI0029C07DFE|nr:hypothetical protein [uncultured Propionivibrio sp.]